MRKSTGAITEYDLIVIGSGSGNSIIGPEMNDMRIAIVERETFGGTCLNRGCIPSKMLIYPADLAQHAKSGAHLGLRTEFHGADWPSIVKRVFGRIDPIAESGREYRHSLSNVDVFEHEARFVGERELEVGGRRIRGEQVVIAAGARSFIPDLPGINDIRYYTSDTIMRIEKLPDHLIVLGGGFIGTELGHVFQALGSKVSIINRSDRLLREEDDDVSRRFTQVAGERFDLVLSATVNQVRSNTDARGGAIAVDVESAGKTLTLKGDVLLIATGRVPNGDQLDAAAGGIAVDDNGAVVVDGFGRTNVRGVWAMGDINGRYQLKHMANGEARVLRHNVMHPDDLHEYDKRPAPHAVFSSPQIGSVGVTERDAIASGLPYTTVTQPYADTAYGWAMEDTTGFCKLIGDPRTRQVIGAHVIGYQASLLIQLLVQGMHLGSTADEMAQGQVWIHPALPEVVENALLKLIEAFDSAD